jgi:hypothetical protein
MQAQPKSRPTGVTIIAILNVIGGIIMLVSGILLVAVGAFVPLIPPSAMQGSEMDLSGIPPALLGGGLIAIGGVITALGIISFIVAYGLLKGLLWAWTLTVVLSIISIALNAISIATANFGGIISIIISGIILYYLYRPHVKSYFGKASAAKPDAGPAA